MPGIFENPSHEVYWGEPYLRWDGPAESEELVKRQIIDMVQSCVTTNLSKRDSSLLESLKIQAHSGAAAGVSWIASTVPTVFIFWMAILNRKRLSVTNRLSVCHNPAAPKPLALAAISFRTAGGGRYPHFTGVSGLLPDSIHQRSEDAYADRQRRRGKIPHWFDSQRHASQRHECGKHSEK
ncbi:MAG: hypothetical protein ACLSBD_12870 [Blautia massiliensis (ex Durand et al. 2017)]